MTPNFRSALFPGDVTHARLKPKVHHLRYRIYSLLLDLDELDTLDKSLRLLSVDRFNLFSFRRKDRGDRSGRDLRQQVEASMRKAGITPDGGRITLLTMPQLLGWAFNPVSVFFCYYRDGDLAGILWEVDNTFGERHAYMIPADAPDDGEFTQACDKAFYVSPFMDMDLHYKFRVRLPNDKFTIKIDTYDADGLVLTARHLGRRVELTDGALLGAFFKIPLLTLKVVGGIHWEALKIWLKGVKLRDHPKAPEEQLSIPRKSAEIIDLPGQ
jgi:DUF1365 family protein